MAVRAHNETRSAKPGGEALDRGAEFSNRGLTIMLGLAAIALLFAFYNLIHEQNRRAGSSTEAVSFDREIFGLRAMLDLLALVDVPARPVSSLARDRYLSRSVVILPDVSRPETVDAALLRFRGARAIVFMLPKRIPTNPLKRMTADAPIHELSPLYAIKRVLNRLSKSASVSRPGGNQAWLNTMFNDVPTIGEVQVVGGPGLMPIVSRDEGAVIARLANRSSRLAPVYVVADPDPFVNHGIDDGDNAQFVVGFLDAIRRGDGRILIDDTAAGAVDPPSFWRELFRPPLVGLTITGLASLALVLMAAFVRFGARAATRENVGSGRGTVLEASVALLANKGHASTALEAYWQQALMTVGQRFRAPKLNDRGEIISFLGSIETERRVSIRAEEIDSGISTSGSPARAQRAVELAQAIHTWRTEMLSGRDRNTTPE